MKSISHWARHHPHSSWLIIGISHLLLGILALWLGALLWGMDTGTVKWPLLCFGNLFFLAFFFYPVKGQAKGLFRFTYFRQKAHDFVLVMAGFLVLAFGANNFLSVKSSPAVAVAQTVALQLDSENEISKVKSIREWSRKEIRTFRKKVRQELRAIKKQSKQSGGQAGSLALKILLITLTVAAAVGLGILVAALACSIACNGAEAMAIVVLILGWGGIIWLGVIGIKHILKIGR